MVVVARAPTTSRQMAHVNDCSHNPGARAGGMRYRRPRGVGRDAGRHARRWSPSARARLFGTHASRPPEPAHSPVHRSCN